jgi:cation transport regulator ChaC
MLAIFAHGSLMFRSHLPVARVRPGTVRGWHRRLGQPSVRNWGRRQAPAPTSSLVPGVEVDGLVLELDDPDGTHLDAVTRREAHDPVEVDVETADGLRRGLTWPMSATWAELDVDDLVAAAVRNVTDGGGPFGNAFDYVDGIVGAMDAHGLDDPFIRDYHVSLRRALEG